MLTTLKLKLINRKAARSNPGLVLDTLGDLRDSSAPWIPNDHLAFNRSLAV